MNLSDNGCPPGMPNELWWYLNCMLVKTPTYQSSLAIPAVKVRPQGMPVRSTLKNAAERRSDESKNPKFGR